MPKLKDRNADQLLGEKLYVEQSVSIEECARACGVNQKTIYRWIREGKWRAKKIEFQELDNLINLNLKRALNKSLNCYIENPKDTDIQNLMTLLLKFTERINENKEKQ